MCQICEIDCNIIIAWNDYFYENTAHHFKIGRNIGLLQIAKKSVANTYPTDLEVYSNLGLLLTSLVLLIGSKS